MKRLIMFLMLTFSIPSYADIVSDVQLIMLLSHQLTELRAQVRILKDSYEAAKGQIDGLNQLKDMNSGHYGFGNLNNGLDALQSWQSPVSTWEDALHNLAGGNEERFKALVEAYEKNHPALNENNYARFVSPDKLARFKEDKAVNRAVQTETTQSYNDINKHIAALHKLSQEIEKTPNTKGAVDLNSRLVTELGFIQLMSLRLQTLMNQQLAQEGLSELQDRADMAKFNYLPK